MGLHVARRSRVRDGLERVGVVDEVLHEELLIVHRRVLLEDINHHAAQVLRESRRRNAIGLRVFPSFDACVGAIVLEDEASKFVHEARAIAEVKLVGAAQR